MTDHADTSRRALPNTTGPPAPRTPKWKRELRLLRRDGLVKYVRLARKVRRFNRSVRRLP